VSVTEVIVARPLALRLEWEGERLRRLRLEWATEGQQAEVRTLLGWALARSLERYVAGEPVEWPELPVDLDALPPFYRRVLTELLRIPAGETLSYGELAARCGSPDGARAVGQAMAKNPWPLVYPCHRVLAAGGKIGGYGPGVEMKRWLLELEEGVPSPPLPPFASR